MKETKILFLSNGNGEDLIAKRIMQRLLKADFRKIRLISYPLVGNGRAIKNLSASLRQEYSIQLLDPRKVMPSGGFPLHTLGAFISDVRAGLFQLLYTQLRVTLRAAKNVDLVIAVGDSYPLLLAYLSQSEYIYVQCKKSDYTWMTPNARLSRFWYRAQGTNWNILERILARSKRCILVTTRDNLSSRNLRRKNINTISINPMIDNIHTFRRHSTLKPNEVTILCLFGGRRDESLRNGILILNTIRSVVANSTFKFNILISASSRSFVSDQRNLAHELLFHPGTKIDSKQYPTNLLNLTVSSGMFREWLPISDLALSLAGTATEQAVAAGLPVFTFPGEGPQFTKRFALKQKRLLADGIFFSHNSDFASQAIIAYLNNLVSGQTINNDVGLRRMRSCLSTQSFIEQLTDLIDLSSD